MADIVHDMLRGLLFLDRVDRLHGRERRYGERRYWPYGDRRFRPGEWFGRLLTNKQVNLLLLLLCAAIALIKVFGQKLAVALVTSSAILRMIYLHYFKVTENEETHEDEQEKDCNSSFLSSDSCREESKESPGYMGFDKAFTTILKNNKDEVKVSNGLRIMRKLIINATTRGQDELNDDSFNYCKVWFSDPHVAECMQLDGSLELMLSVGFVIGGNKDDEKGLHLEYLFMQNCPSWLRDALDQMEHHEQEIQNREAQRKSREAAIARQQAALDKQRKTQTRQAGGGKYSAGLGAGDSRSIYYAGGT